MIQKSTATADRMETFSQYTNDQPTATCNGNAANLSQPVYNPYNVEERGTLNSTIQALYMPSVEEFFTDFNF